MAPNSEIQLASQAPPEDAIDYSATSSTYLELKPVSRKRQISVLVSSFLTIFVVVGLNQSYGIFQTYYMSMDQSMLPLSDKKSPAILAFVGTLGSGLTWGGSIFVNPLMERVQKRGWITVTGVLLTSLGLGLASLSTKVIRDPFSQHTNQWHFIKS